METNLSENQVSIKIDQNSDFINEFTNKLKSESIYPLTPTKIEIFQINMGKICNNNCVHCHVEAGPHRTESIKKEILENVLDVIKSENIKIVDITGGAPELNPNLKWFIAELSNLNIEIIIRTNLTILQIPEYKDFIIFFKENHVTLIASLPCYTKENVDAQRGNNTYENSIQSIKELNEQGYGMENSELNLHLVYNPGSPSLPAPQLILEADYKRELWNRFNIKFNKLYTITNLPIGRFKQSLIDTKQLDKYYKLLIDSFNPLAAENVMCRNLISISWEGYLYDCDFNQMLDLKIGDENPMHISQYDSKILNSRKIIVKNHCFGCTAGSGSSCQGTII